jgi:hypothetical protein
VIRDQKALLDSDLAELYDVETRALKQAVRRNLDRFPEDFMFELNAEEFRNLRSQFVLSSWGGKRHTPMAFEASDLQQNKHIHDIYTLIRGLLDPPVKAHKAIGFKIGKGR